MMKMMREQSHEPVESLSSSSSVSWFYLSFEFLLGLGISGFVLFLGLVRSLLPKPGRDLSGDVVLVTGASSKLGGLLVEEFGRAGCSVVCVDAVESNRRLSAYAYECDLWDREQIRALAKRVHEDVGRVDVLVTCAATNSSARSSFDSLSESLLSHYWTVMAFLPSMLHRERAHVIGITPSASTEDAYRGSKAAVAGFMESLGEQLSGRNNRLTFITVAPKAEPSLLKQSERDIAKEVVHAVQRDLPSISPSWSSKLLYHLSCWLYGVITTITTWLDT